MSNKVIQKETKNKNWTAKDDDFLRNNYKSKGMKFCSKNLDRSNASVRVRAGKLQLAKHGTKKERNPNISSMIWLNLLRGAQERNLEVSIKFSDIWQLYLDQNCRCALSGILINFSKKLSESTASVDRIDSSKGYTLDNIQIVHKYINKMKQDFSDEEFTQFCKHVSRNSYDKIIEEELWNNS